MLILIGNYRGSRRTKVTIALPYETVAEIVDLHTSQPQAARKTLAVDVQPDSVALYAVRGK